MKRAEVWKHRYSGAWRVSHWPSGVIIDRHLSIGERTIGNLDPREFPTHAAALAHALAEVGLDRPAEHREAP